MTDLEIIGRYKDKGDKQLIGELYKRYTHLVYGVCYKYLQNRDDCNDAVMQIFEELFDKLKKHDISNFSSWLHSVARNHCLMKLRKKTPEKYHVEINENILENYVESEVEVHLNNKDNKTDEEKLKEALSKLNPDQKKCVELFFLQEKSYNEVAQITGFTLKQVKSFLQNGKRNLVKVMSD